MEDAMKSPYLTVEEVAKLLRRSTKWVYCQKKQIPGYFRIAGSILFDREILMDHLRELAFKPTRKASRSVETDKYGLL